MKKVNYRVTVNIQEDTMKLGLRASLPREAGTKKLRVDAVFSQRLTKRYFPMEVTLAEDEEMELVLRADADILLPYVFYSPPRHKVSVTFALWCGTEEWILDDQPFPVQKELFARTELVRKTSRAKFALCTLGLPVLLVREYIKEEKNMSRALKQANNTVYKISGLSYSARQRNTDYFASAYRKAVAKNPVNPKQILFLSEREPEEGGNLMLVKKWFEKEADVTVREFLLVKTVDALKKKELEQCARLCATSAVIILEDFYPQLHSIRKRPETNIVQLWHACGAFKTFGLTRMGKQGGAPQTSMNHRNYDMVCVSSEKIRDIYAEAFGISPAKVEALGVPRTDVLFDWEYKKKKREELYDRYPGLKESRVILFAPTFRGDGNKDAHYPEEAFDVAHFMEAQEEDAVLVLKNHPFVKTPLFVPPQWADRVLDLSGREQINDLMLISDLFITDYSSAVFEAELLELPMLFYAFDEKEYMESRDFYFDYEDFTPGLVVSDFEALCEKAAEMVAGRSKESTGEDVSFREVFLSALDGRSTEKICKKIKTKFIKN